jgi:release factor glutamine methyltransferase
MTDPQTIASVVASAAERLAAVSESPRLDAELLVARAIDMPRAYLFAHPEDVLDADAGARLEETLRRRIAGEPLAYITGTREFWSLELMVTPATLVPRPETELLVELALRQLPRRAAARVLDLGTGSGAVALAIAGERPNCAVTAIDTSRDALAVAEQNVRHLELGNVRCLVGDWTQPVRGERFELIVSNPPYVAQGDPALQALRAEPASALVAGADGLDAIRVIARDCVGIIAPQGLLLIEHGADQEGGVRAVLEANGWEGIACHRDYAGHPRVTSARAPAGQGQANCGK